MVNGTGLKDLLDHIRPIQLVTPSVKVRNINSSVNNYQECQRTKVLYAIFFHTVINKTETAQS